jgi:hypothetical protein
VKVCWETETGMSSEDSQFAFSKCICFVRFQKLVRNGGGVPGRAESSRVEPAPAPLARPCGLQCSKLSLYCQDVIAISRPFWVRIAGAADNSVFFRCGMVCGMAEVMSLRAAERQAPPLRKLNVWWCAEDAPGCTKRERFRNFDRA